MKKSLPGGIFSKFGKGGADSDGKCFKWSVRPSVRTSEAPRLRCDAAAVSER